MGDVNWAIGLQGGNAGQAFAQAFESGQERKRERETKDAMRALVGNPDDAKAMSDYTFHDPAGAMAFKRQHASDQRQQHEDALKATEAHRDSIVRGGQIFRQYGVKDEATYQQARQAAAQMGMDLSQVPPNYDQQYVEGVVHLADAFEPQKPEQRPQLVPYTAGGGVAQLNPQTGQLETLVMPNQGGHAAGSPVNGGGVPQVHDQASYDAIPPGAQYTTPDGHIRVKQGGPSQPAAGGFPGSY